MNKLEYLPFVVRPAAFEEMDKVRALRKKGYSDAHGPEFGEAAAATDGFDDDTYVAVSKLDNSILGTIRFHSNAQCEPLPLEHDVDLPPEFRYVVTAEATRLVAPRSPAVQQALFKAFRSKDWEGAKAAIAHGRTVHGVPAELLDTYEKRIHHYAYEPPPANWDGSWSAKEK